MRNKISVEILEKWLKAWSLSRNLPLPVQYKSGFKVEVGDKTQKERYVFSAFNDDFLQLCHTIDEPWIYLKVCASPEEFMKNIPSKWKLQPQGYMMGCFHPMRFPETRLPEGYSMEYDHYHSTFVVRIMAKNGELASIGRVVLVDGLAVYDRIVTEEKYRRQGLATFVIRELEKMALSEETFKNFLVATEEGKKLYESLGWKVSSLYTSVVILPGT